MTVNVHRRHLDEFQRAEIGLKWDKIVRRIASEKMISLTTYGLYPGDISPSIESNERTPDFISSNGFTSTSRS